MSKSSERMRVEWKAGDELRDAGLTTPEDILRYDDLSYGPDPVWNLLDVYRPKEKQGKLPVIVNIHGGGWVYGNKEIYQFYGMSLAQRGFAVVNFNYRLAPEHKFPAHLCDVNMVMEWMYEYQDRYGLDMDQVFMVGDSAGAHLCGLYCAICTDPDYAKKYPFQIPNGFVPTAVALNCGVCNPLSDQVVISEEEDKDLMEDLLPERGSESERKLINLTNHVNKNFPPVYLMSCIGDFCLPQANLMEKELQKHGVKHTFRIYGSEKHPLYHVFHVNMREEEGKKCNDDECRFFREFLSREIEK